MRCLCAKDTHRYTAWCNLVIYTKMPKAKDVGHMRIQVLTTTVLSATLLSGCLKGGGCPDNIGDYSNIYTAVGISDFVAFERLADGTLQRLDDTMPVAIGNLELRVDLEFTKRNFNQPLASWTVLDFFVKPVHACSPGPSYVESVVSQMDLISTASLSPELSPGVSLNTSFSAKTERGSLSIDIFNNRDSKPLDQYGSPSSYTDVVGGAYILTASPTRSVSPQATELHQFTFSIELRSGELFEIVSDGVLISSVNEP